MIDIGQIWEYAITLVLATVGGMARLLHTKGKKKLRWQYVLSQLFIAAAVGMIVVLVARANGLQGDLVAAIAGIAGWLGPQAMDLVVHAVETRTGIRISDEEKK